MEHFIRPEDYEGNSDFGDPLWAIAWELSCINVYLSKLLDRQEGMGDSIDEIVNVLSDITIPDCISIDRGD